MVRPIHFPDDSEDLETENRCPEDAEVRNEKTVVCPVRRKCGKPGVPFTGIWRLPRAWCDSCLRRRRAIRALGAISNPLIAQTESQSNFANRGCSRRTAGTFSQEPNWGVASGRTQRSIICNAGGRRAEGLSGNSVPSWSCVKSLTSGLVRLAQLSDPNIPVAHRIVVVL